MKKKLKVRKAVLQAAADVVCTTFPNRLVRAYTTPLRLNTEVGSVVVSPTKPTEEADLKSLTDEGRKVADAITKILGISGCWIYGNNITVNVGHECGFGENEGIHTKINEILATLFPNPKEVTFKKVRDKSNPRLRDG